MLGPETIDPFFLERTQFSVDPGHPPPSYRILLAISILSKTEKAPYTYVQMYESIAFILSISNALPN